MRSLFIASQARAPSTYDMNIKPCSTACTLKTGSCTWLATVTSLFTWSTWNFHQHYFWGIVLYPGQKLWLYDFIWVFYCNSKSSTDFWSTLYYLWRPGSDWAKKRSVIFGEFSLFWRDDRTLGWGWGKKSDGFSGGPRLYKILLWINNCRCGPSSVRPTQVV